MDGHDGGDGAWGDGGVEVGVGVGVSGMVVVVVVFAEEGVEEHFFRGVDPVLGGGGGG